MAKRNIFKIILIFALSAAIVGGAYIYMTNFSVKARSARFISEAETYFAQGEYAAADLLYESALKIDQDNQAAIEGRVRASLKEGDPVTAGIYLDRMEQFKKDSPEYRSLLYDYAMQSGDYALADSLLITNEDYQPSADEYRRILNGLLLEQYYPQAVAAVERAIEDYPGDRGFLELAFSVYRNAGENKKLLTVFEAGVEPRNFEEINLLADLYWEEDQPAKAVNLWERSIATNFYQAEIQDKLYRYYAGNSDVAKLWQLRRTLLEARIQLPELGLNFFGNTAANVRYRGMVVQQGDRLYLTDRYKQQINTAPVADPSARSLVLDRSAQGLNVQGDWLYFVNLSAQNGLYRVKTDGSELSPLWEEPVINPLVWGDKIYFLEKQGERLRRISIHGGDAELLSETKILHYALDGEWIYYIDEAGRDVYRLLQSGGRAEQLYSGRFSDINVDEYSRLYFLDLDRGTAIVAAANDGSNLELLSEEGGEYLNYGEGMLYFVKWTPHSLPVAGGDSVNLTSNMSYELAVCPDWIFSLGYDTQLINYPRLYYFKTDGTAWTPMPD